MTSRCRQMVRCPRQPTRSCDIRLGIDVGAPASRKSSIFLGRKIGVVFMRVNSKCARQVRPPPGPDTERHGRWVRPGSSPAEALHRIHSMATAGCPFRADWVTRLHRAEHRIRCGLVDERDFDEVNLGRTAADILAELQSLPALPPVSRFTHGDACLPNFLTQDGLLTGIVDLGGAGVAHPAQDWALALRSMRNNFGSEAEQSLRTHVPQHCEDEALLRRFLLLDELF
jgi:aminoglycoside phosphotransferase (APT) family kinase protein